MTAEEVSRFEAARRKIIGKDRERTGIGTLSEKTVHAVLKYYYAPDERFHELAVEGCVADIFDGKQIVEIQTGSFDKMRTKLERFLPLYPVTIVYPIPYKKLVYWVDEATGEISGGRKSPLTGSPYLAFRELYKIKMYLKHPKLSIRLVLLNMEEYKLLNGWSHDRKRGAGRFDRIPLSVESEVELTCPQDYMQFVPYGLEEPFTSAQLGKAAHIRKETAGVVCHVLNELSVLQRTGKKGNAYLYVTAEG